MKIASVRAIFQKLADEQPTHSTIKTWLLEAADPTFPAFVLQRLDELFAEGGE